MGSGNSKPAETQKHAIQPLPGPRFESNRKRPFQNPPSAQPRGSHGPDTAYDDDDARAPRLTHERPRSDLNFSNKLRPPQDQHPIRPSWLHQSNTNERYKHVDSMGTRDSDNEYLHRRQIAINRWQDDDPYSETTTKKPKSFYDEYIHP